MIKKLLPLVLIIVFGGAGVAAGLMLKPEEKEQLTELGPCGEDPNAKTAEKEPQEPKKSVEGESVAFEYVKLNNQFIVPIIRNDTVESMAIVALSIEVKAGTRETVYAVEPKLRDVFLQALFDHASLGGFDGAFATTENLQRMRRALKENAVAVLGDIVNDVLVTDIARQDN